MAAAYAHFTTKGYRKTTLSEIANSLKMSKKTIYLLFQSKEGLFIEAGNWKMASLIKQGTELIESDQTFIEKLIQYLELVYDNTRHVNIDVLKHIYHHPSTLSKIIAEYLDGAVFSRFKSLIEQGEKEQMIDERIDIHVSLIMFKETLESYLFGSSSSYSTQTHEKEFHVFMCIQLRSFFRCLLSKKGTIIFDELLDQRAHLTRAYA